MISLAASTLVRVMVNQSTQSDQSESRIQQSCRIKSKLSHSSVKRSQKVHLSKCTRA